MTAQELPKIYDPKATEDKWYRKWESEGLFHAAPNPDRTPFTIMIPPPNVTGILHMGHALQGTLQDALIRYHRMRGHETLWMPGTDHAGIATQNVVERSLRKAGTTKEELGREGFLKAVWAWKEKHGNIISQQERKLGASCDWERESFTMDAERSAAVREVFVRLYEKKLIYRGRYVINWCPKLMTTLSDEEVNHKEVQGHLWYFRYPLTDSDVHITVATTRPETMLGDTAVAVNPTDERYAHFVGKTITLPLHGRIIPIIADNFVDASFGTGAVKVTPAHDPNDFAIGMRHKLSFPEVIGATGAMTEEAGETYAGLDRFECRKRVVADMEAANLLEKIEDHTHQVGHCSRTGDVIEPRVSIQWFVKMQPLAEPAIAAVQSGDITFHPARWSKVYLDWMENIRDWCISRQLWWGHRIPVWYCEDCQEVIVQREDPTQCPSCSSTRLQQDPDVLDTWFSSWLWPFATLGWPKKTAELDYFYPTNVLVSGYDIIFFWIARMIMAGYEFLGEKPFSQVYITSMIKDAQGRIMSKSLKNGIDPIDMIEQYGADAVRYSLVALATEGQDIKLSQGKFEMGRNFGNKVWNTYRFILANRQPTAGNGAAGTPAPQLMDRWILSRLAATQDLVAASFDRYKLNDALNAVYDFLWHDYCDWYLELLKDRVGPQGSDPDIVNRVATPVLEEVMILLHPFMPFITEEIWQGLGGGARDSIMRAAPGSRIAATLDPDADGQMRILRQITLVVRNIRGEMSIPPQRAVPTIIATTNTESGKVLQEFAGYLKRMAKVASLEVRESYQPSEATATGIISDMEVYVPLAGLIDLGVERQRLEKERQRLEQFLQSLAGKLQNENFVANAPADVVQKERDKFAECESNHQKILRTLATLSETS